MAGGADQPDRSGGDLPDLDVAPAPPAPGDATLASLLGSRYRVAARLGKGAFGEVYRAHDAVLGREVAVKRIRLEAFVEPSQLDEVKQRFLREAQIAARLRHPNIVTTHDIVEGAGTSFIVMELVEGETLQSRLQSRGRLSLDETTAILEQAARALDHAHASGIVHRDVKPGNIMIEPSGHVKVMDFGIAKADAGQNLTSTGLVMGTPNYMSPEQARGQRVDGRSDLFALGCVLYECLTGHKPFAGESITAILLKIITEEPAPPDYEATGLPRGIDAVLRKALAKDPAARYDSGAALVSALRLAGETTVVSAPTGRVAPPSAPAPEGEPTRARPRLRLLGAVVALAAVLASAGLLGSGLLSSLAGRERRVAGEGGGLVVEESPRLLARLLGHAPRLAVTVPAGSRLRLAVEAPLSSATAREGDPLSATLTAAVRVEGVEAIETGARLSGRVLAAAPARAAEGRGSMTLEFEALEAGPSGTLQVRARPLVLRAPASRKKDTGIIAGLAGVGAALGGLLGGKGGAVAGTVVGGAAGVVVVSTDDGREVALAAGAPLTVELLEPVTLSRPKPR